MALARGRRNHRRTGEDDHARAEDRDDDEQRPPGVARQRAPREDQPGEQSAHRGRAAKQAEPDRARVQDRPREDRRERDRAAEEHGEQVERDRAEDDLRAPDEADPGEHGVEARRLGVRLACGLVHHEDAGEADGAKIVVDGRNVVADGGQDGFWLGPTLIDHVTTDMSIYTDEIFGPVLSVVRVESYDEALQLLARRGYKLDASVLNRDWTQPYTFNASVEQAWLEVYRSPNDRWNLYELAEELVDLEDSFRTWRFRHMTTVKRIIGFKRGTGGTSCVGYLTEVLEIELFPELWRVRTSL